MEFDYTLHHPFVFVISGSTQSGKSTLVDKILTRKNEIIFPSIVKIVYCFVEEQQDRFEKLKQALGDSISFQRGMEFEIPEDNEIPTLIILDDFMDEISGSYKSQICELATRGSHHRSLSVIITLQNFFYKNLRTLTLNAKYIVILKNPRDMTMIKYLSREIGTKNLLETGICRCHKRKTLQLYIY